MKDKYEIFHRYINYASWIISNDFFLIFSYCSIWQKLLYHSGNICHTRWWKNDVFIYQRTEFYFYSFSIHNDVRTYVVCLNETTHPFQFYIDKEPAIAQKSPLPTRLRSFRPLRFSTKSIFPLQWRSQMKTIFLDQEQLSFNANP